MKTNNISFLIAFSVINAFTFHASAALTGSEILKVNKGGTVNKIYTSNLPTLKVATYNIGKNEAADNVKDLTHLSQAIGKINADIIAVTEIDNQTQRSGKINQLADIAQANHLFYAFGKALDFDGGEYGVGLLSKYKIDKSQVINLPSGEAEQRVVLISQLAVPGFDSPVIVMTTHLDWQKNPEVRLNQARYLLDLSIGDAPSNFANIASAVKILAGDFNSTANEQPVKEINYFWNPVVKNGVDLRTWPAINPALDLDHIFTFKGQKWNVKGLNVPDEKEGFNWAAASDHLPLIAELELQEQ